MWFIIRGQFTQHVLGHLEDSGLSGLTSTTSYILGLDVQDGVEYLNAGVALIPAQVQISSA